MHWRIILICVTTATLAVGSQCGPPTFPSALHRRHLQFPDGFHVNWANTNSFFCSVFLWIVKFHFIFRRFSSLRTENCTLSSHFRIKDTLRNLWFYYDGYHCFLHSPAIKDMDSCWSWQPLLLRIRNVPGSVLGPASIMIGGGAYVRESPPTLPENARILPGIRPLPLPSASLPIHCTRRQFYPRRTDSLVE